MQVVTFPVTLEETINLTPQIKHFVFKTPESSAFNYVPGQFITIHFDSNEKQVKRSYSIANAPVQDNRIEFAAGFVEGGPGTELLFNLKPGDQININGPFGRLILKDEQPKRYILAATSTGVTPYRAMLPELRTRLDKSPDLQVIILLGVQTIDDALYAQEFAAFAESYPQQVSLRIQLSRAADQILSTYYFHGYVQHAFPELNLNPENDIVYLCGNPGMIDEAFENLKTRGFVMQQIIREKYISR